MKKVPKGGLITIDEIRQVLEKRHRATVGSLPCQMSRAEPSFSFIERQNIFKGTKDRDNFVARLSVLQLETLIYRDF